MACSSSNVIAVTVTNDPQTHEDAHVHEVYDQIAHHFSMTRYKVGAITNSCVGDIYGSLLQHYSHGLL